MTLCLGNKEGERGLDPDHPDLWDGCRQSIGGQRSRRGRVHLAGETMGRGTVASPPGRLALSARHFQIFFFYFHP